MLFEENERNEQEEHITIAFENFEIDYYVWFACFLQYSIDGQLSLDFLVSESIEFHYHGQLESKQDFRSINWIKSDTAFSLDG